MHEVKIYDSSGKLKKVISVKSLNIRSNEQLESPSLFRKDKKTGKSWTKSNKSQIKAEIQQP
jgi:hypothetical protein